MIYDYNSFAYYKKIELCHTTQVQNPRTSVALEIHLNLAALGPKSLS